MDGSMGDGDGGKREEGATDEVVLHPILSIVSCVSCRMRPKGHTTSEELLLGIYNVERRHYDEIGRWNAHEMSSLVETEDSETS